MLLTFSVSLINLPWCCFSFHCLCLSSFFCFLVVDTGSSYCGKILSLLENLNSLSSNSSSYGEKFCFSVSTQPAMLRIPCPFLILGMHIPSLSLCGWYILFTVIIFFVFLSITSSSSFVHSSIPAIYLSEDIAWEFWGCQLSHSPKIFLLDLIFHFRVHYVISFQNT